MCFLEGLVLVPARARFIFAVARRWHGQGPELFLYHVMSLPGQGEGSLFWEEGFFFSGQVGVAEVG